MPIPDPIPFLLVLARVAGLVLAAPLFGHLLVPLRVRIGLAVLLTVALVPVVPPPVALPTSLWGLGGAVAAESALGALMGFVAQLVFAGAQLGGQLAGIQMGFGMANLIDPQAHAQVTVVAEWQSLITLLVFVLLDGHHLLIRAMIESLRVAPAGALVLAPTALRDAVGLAGDVFATGVRLAAPVLIVLLLTNAAMGVLARTIPQLNVFVVGFPVNVGVGLLVTGAALPFAVRFLGARFTALEPTLGALVRGLTHG
ncbi:MAG: flagellar biosynthetic protein FliR [Candidatus Binatia bacterium]